MKSHPFADILPLLEGEAFDVLVADIRANGLLEPITLHEGMILDGRNRLKACNAAGVEPRFLEFTGDDPLAFVLSLNVHRRHLSESQRAMVVAKLETLKHGGDRKGDQAANLHLDRRALASLLNVSPRTVASAAAVRDHALPELVQAVDRGDISVSVAAGLATASEEAQRRAVADPTRAHVLVKQERREQREVELAGKILALPDKKYVGIFADPEWRDEVWSRETGLDRAPDNHYSTSPAEVIQWRPVGDLAAYHSVLFLWSTIQHEAIAHEVMKAWGFEYKSQFIWVKPSISLGRWIRSRHEIMLIGTRGNPPCPAPGMQWPSVIEAERGVHSEKPKAFYELVEAYFPNAPKIELNCRGKARPGWDAWGNEVEPR